jgi:TonB family protein
VVTDIWKSPDLKIATALEYSDATFGKRLIKLTNIVRGDQPVSLFAPSPDYSIEEGPYEAGGGVKLPEILHKVEAEYTQQAQAAHYSGAVRVTVIVGKNGLPLAFSFDKPTGYGLDQAAIDAVSHWRFKPGTRNGEPVAILTHIEVSFRYL